MLVDVSVALAGLPVGFVVGLTGMGGGALMTPMLVLLFGVQPLAAVSSDLVASVIMKPVGGGVHLRRGTVNGGLVKWLVLGSVPAAFGGVLLLKALGDESSIEERARLALGIALLVVSAALALKALIARRSGNEHAPLVVRPLITVMIGVVGGLVVGMTSVGSGSLMMILLIVLYPHIRLSQLVGTDLVQAVPLVASAALAHILFGSFQLGLTVSILLGAVPGVYLGARLSSRAPDHLIRPALMIVLLASGLKLLGVSNEALLWVVVAFVVSTTAVLAVAARRQRALATGAAEQRSVEPIPAVPPSS
jgi:uncharacterized membrane protein YfcA